MNPRRGLALVAGVVAVVLATSAPPASAGGSPIQPARDRYEPGETVTMVGYTGSGDPMAVPLEAYRSARPIGAGRTGERVPLGPLTIQETSRTDASRYRVAISFTLPTSAPPGQYEVGFDGALGDLMGWSVWVGVDPPRPLIRYWPADDPALQGADASVPLSPVSPTTMPAPPPTTATSTDRRAGKGSSSEPG